MVMLELCVYNTLLGKFLSGEVRKIFLSIEYRNDVNMMCEIGSTHYCLETSKRVIGKHCRPRSDAT